MTSSLGTFFNARKGDHLEQYVLPRLPSARSVCAIRRLYVASAIQPYGIAYNTNLVPAATRSTGAGSPRSEVEGQDDF